MKKQTKIIRLKGIVFSGTGEGAKFTELPWVKSQIKEKFGFTPYTGTLNIKLDRNHLKVRKMLEKKKSVIILPEPGYCRGKCFKAYVMGSVEGAVILPEVEGYPNDVLEVVAPINLREKFGFKDGDTVEVIVVLE